LGLAFRVPRYHHADGLLDPIGYPAQGAGRAEQLAEHHRFGGHLDRGKRLGQRDLCQESHIHNTQSIHILLRDSLNTDFLYQGLQGLHLQGL